MITENNKEGRMILIFPNRGSRHRLNKLFCVSGFWHKHNWIILHIHWHFNNALQIQFLFWIFGKCNLISDTFLPFIIEMCVCVCIANSPWKNMSSYPTGKYVNQFCKLFSWQFVKKYKVYLIFIIWCHDKAIIWYTVV